MTVFKNYFKIFKTLIPTVMIYVVIFLGIAIAMNVVNNNNNTDSKFEGTKVKIAYINHDKDTKLLKSFEKYLGDVGEIVDIGTDEDRIKDELFFRHVDYVIEVPENFTVDFMSNKDVNLVTRSVPDSTGNIFTEILLNQYMNKARVYMHNGMDQEQISKFVKKDLNTSSNVIINSDKEATSEAQNLNYYTNYLNYIFLGILSSVIGLIMSSYNNVNLKKRNLSSPISNKKITFELGFASFVITLGIYLLFMILACILYPSAMFSTYGLLIALNSFIFVISVFSISFFIGNVMTSQEAISAVSNIISLGSSFMCGCFVPQAYLNATVLGIGKLFPTYWFIKNNDTLVTLSKYNLDTLGPIFANMGVMLGMALIIYILTNIVAKRKSRKEAW